MKSYFIILLFLIAGSQMTLYSQENILQAIVHFEEQSLKMEEFIDQISTKTNILFSYSSQKIDSDQMINLNKGVKSLEEVLSFLKEYHQVDYMLFENQVILKRAGSDEIMDLSEELFSVNGYLYDSSSGESLIGASVMVSGTGFGTITNGYGYYSISLPKGKYELEFSYIAYEKEIISFHLTEDRTQTVFLKPSRILLPAVLIKIDHKREILNSSQMSLSKIQTDVLDEMPEFGGEVGLVKGLQTLPGIKSHSDGSAFFFVRGGGRDQNLIMIDDAPVYNPSHLFGYYSMVIPDFTKDIKVYKADMPVNLGDRLSSIIDIRTKDGNLNKFHMTGMINPLVSRFSVDGPLIRGKSSFFTSLRWSNFQWLYQRYVPNLNFGFNDLNIKWNYTPNKKNRFFFSYFLGSDLLANNYNENTQNGIRWNNMATSLRWNHIINDKTFVNTVLVASIYQYQLFLANNNWRSNIAQVSLRSDVSYFPRPDLNIKYGYNLSAHAFDPGSLTLSGNIKFFPSITSGKSRETDLFAKAEYRLNKDVSIGAGFRMPMWFNSGPTTLYIYDENYELKDTQQISNNEIYKGFVNFDPRLSISYKLDSFSNIKLSYGRYHQYIHLLSNSTSPFTSIEVWLPSGNNIKPQNADQFALGYYHQLKKWKMNFSAEAYYKFMRNQIDYKPYASMIINPLVDGELRFGRANAYGIELLLERKHQKLNGWVSYSYSRVFRKTPGINEGKSYRAFGDRPHDFSIFLNYKISEKKSFSANWNYYTGSPITMPVSYYSYLDQTVPVFGEKNNVRLPDYHRLDLSYEYRFNKASSKFKHSLKFSIYNVYARKNPVSINYNKIKQGDKLLVPSDYFGGSELVYSQLDLLRFMPSISYKFEL